MNKGVVLQLYRFKMTVLTSDGQFITIWRQRNCQVGQMVTWKAYKPASHLSRIAVSVAVALLLIVVTGESSPLQEEKIESIQPVIQQEPSAPSIQTVNHHAVIEQKKTVQTVKATSAQAVAVVAKVPSRATAKVTVKVVKAAATISEAPAIQTSETFKAELSQEPAMLPREGELPLENSVESLPPEMLQQEQPAVVESLQQVEHSIT